LIVRESLDRFLIIESCEDALDVVIRLFGRTHITLEGIKTTMAASNERLTAGLRETAAKIAANQPLLEKTNGHDRIFAGQRW